VLLGCVLLPAGSCLLLTGQVPGGILLIVIRRTLPPPGIGPRFDSPESTPALLFQVDISETIYRINPIRSAARLIAIHSRTPDAARLTSGPLGASLYAESCATLRSRVNSVEVLRTGPATTSIPILFLDSALAVPVGNCRNYGNIPLCQSVFIINPPPTGTACRQTRKAYRLNAGPQ
jgi:hypothetical protein